MIKDVKVYPAKGTQNRRILECMRQGILMTPVEALRLAGSFRLSQRIIELEAMGWEIERGWVKTAGGARVRSYRLAS